MDTNHAYRIIARGLLAKARVVAAQGQHFGGKVPLSLVCNMTDAEERDQLLDMLRLGLIDLRRADLMAAWDAKFGREVMAASELTDRGSQWHAIYVPNAEHL